MACGLGYLLRDSLGRGWRMDLDSDTRLRITFVSLNSGAPLILGASNGWAVAYRVDVAEEGMLFTIPADYSDALPKKVSLSGGVSETWDLVVDTSGLLMSVFRDQTPQLVLGQLLPQPEGYPPAVQPGGAGTPVTHPAQTIGEIRGRWRPGCGHSVNSWDILRMSVACVPSAIVCCPLCHYVQRIFSPYTLMYDIVQNPLIFA